VNTQPDLFGGFRKDDAERPPANPAEEWDRKATKRALDELFCLTHQYRASKTYKELLDFVARFRFYAPFNAMLVHIQMPGAKFALSPRRWHDDYSRHIKPGARPLVILQTMGPVMFIFDVSDTEGRPLPPQVEDPFEVQDGRVGDQFERTIENAKRDGVAVHTRDLGSQQGGSIGLRPVRSGRQQDFRDEMVPVLYELELAEDAGRESRYATLVHELGHLYCGHLGTPNDRWWPDRRGLSHQVIEFEAESIAYLVCQRCGIRNTSAEYLAGYVQDNQDTPPISLECVMKAAGLVEKMGRKALPLRKTAKEE